MLVLLILDEGDDVTEKLAETINTNFTGVIFCTREAVRLIKLSGDYGTVININDICGHYLPSFEEESLNVYAATKFALTALSEVPRH
ncbi:CLUMA_CG005723, isoform A [Clunio marinus]|uniref:CLUMA_CG005723, isoform A n=1 Tax=Clunio marinus TaxID=568069 RepID=A0A1J1I1B6_9DIPT|nr:CLUMA_CG005723, isoform A [Clunio marinus]